jgi:hypothetical protein
LSPKSQNILTQSSGKSGTTEYDNSLVSRQKTTEEMMRNITKLIGTLALMLAAISANAQRVTQVTVPFEFAAAGHILPPGDYRVSYNESTELLTLRMPDLSSIILLTAAGDQFNDERNVLRFQRFGGEWSLRQAVFAGLVRVVPAPKLKAKETASDTSSDPAMIELPTVARGRLLSSNEGMN